jgi:transcriptional regulator with XRE-family HTH domain
MPRSKNPKVIAMYEHVARNLRRAREKRLREGKRMTQTAVAVAIEVDPQMIARWERGDTQIGAVHLKQLADLYEIPVEAFFEENHKFLPPTETESKGTAKRISTRPQQ